MKSPEQIADDQRIVDSLYFTLMDCWPEPSKLIRAARLAFKKSNNVDDIFPVLKEIEQTNSDIDLLAMVRLARIALLSGIDRPFWDYAMRLNGLI